MFLNPISIFLGENPFIFLPLNLFCLKYADMDIKKIFLKSHFAGLGFISKFLIILFLCTS